ncbi:Undecaprenyl phosphate N,N'-diacetylbacillosamine 1-phosphate transferase [Pelotomaculum schinkii]|uniref:Undecaprenyl phosphate N,N'-diacetylbacillosamine 1-phosphate transferase n=1 Tax=Pelotomaculum schinkii TaxID=78350 RepID=A0A4Y7RGU7_9FIRM|nr:sugar transferase [Pelotomaculum schinkii]TEB08224.1 Undecaprenyl phosphate N,N'-diacetylbacillosamine 1-phosphate transferase [Pelotomaculum schinkii]
MYRYFFKRLFDVMLALIALPFWFIILVVIGPIIYFQDKGSIFYNAPRLGKDGKVFKMYKFRSMKMNSPDIRNEDGSTFNSEDDPRLTKIGKFIRKASLDETPQLLNIIKGDMSIIGPRPDLPEHRELYEGNEERKLEVRPGVSGYNQAYYRNTIPWKERIQHDIYYIDHLSLWLDIKIFCKTAVSVLKREDIYVAPSCGVEAGVTKDSVGVGM